MIWANNSVRKISRKNWPNQMDFHSDYLLCPADRFMLNPKAWLHRPSFMEWKFARNSILYRLSLRIIGTALLITSSGLARDRYTVALSSLLSNLRLLSSAVPLCSICLPIVLLLLTCRILVIIHHHIPLRVIFILAAHISPSLFSPWILSSLTCVHLGTLAFGVSYLVPHAIFV